MGTTSVIPFVREALPTLRSVSFSAILEQRLVSSSISIGTSRGGGWDVGFLGTGGAVACSSSMNYGSSSQGLVATGGLFSFRHGKSMLRLRKNEKKVGAERGKSSWIMVLFPSLSPSWSPTSVSCSEKWELKEALLVASFLFGMARESTRLQKRGGSKIGERVFVALFPSLSPSWSLASVSCSEKCEVAR
ncbi:hypothetical protein Ancab_030753 [Ancistrocladus abbreviatus]